MPKTTETANLPTIYTVEVPPIKQWDKDNGVWLEPKFYSTPAWVKYHEKMIVLEGKAQTDDIQTALDMVDMGAQVTPDPRPIWQEQYAAQLAEECENNPVRQYEFYRYVTDTNLWRQAHNLKPLSVEAPKVHRPISALMQGMQ